MTANRLQAVLDRAAGGHEPHRKPNAHRHAELPPHRHEKGAHRMRATSSAIDTFGSITEGIMRGGIRNAAQ